MSVDMYTDMYTDTYTDMCRHCVCLYTLVYIAYKCTYSPHIYKHFVEMFTQTFEDFHLLTRPPTSVIEASSPK